MGTFQLRGEGCNVDYTGPGEAPVRITLGVGLLEVDERHRVAER